MGQQAQGPQHAAEQGQHGQHREAQAARLNPEEQQNQQAPQGGEDHGLLLHDVDQVQEHLRPPGGDQRLAIDAHRLQLTDEALQLGDLPQPVAAQHVTEVDERTVGALDREHPGQVAGQIRLGDGLGFGHASGLLVEKVLVWIVAATRHLGDGLTQGPHGGQGALLGGQGRQVGEGRFIAPNGLELAEALLEVRVDAAGARLGARDHDGLIHGLAVVFQDLAIHLIALLTFDRELLAGVGELHVAGGPGGDQGRQQTGEGEERGQTAGRREAIEPRRRGRARRFGGRDGGHMAPAGHQGGQQGVHGQPRRDDADGGDGAQLGEAAESAEDK